MVDPNAHRETARYFGLALLAVFVLALGIRLTYLYAARSGPLGNPDTPAYEALAHSIGSGHYYSSVGAGPPGGYPDDLLRPPGYPLFIYLVSLGTTASRLRIAMVQCLIGAFFSVLLALVTRRLTNAIAGALAGLFYALDWITIVHTPLAIADSLFAILLTSSILSFAFYLRRQQLWWSILSGLLLGVAAFVKPVAQLELLPLLALWLFQRKRRATGLAFALVFAACVLPWMARNAKQHGVFTLSTVDISMFYFYTAQAATDDASSHDPALSAKVNRLDEEWQAKTMSPAERKREMIAESLSIVRREWPVVLKQALRGLAHTALGTGPETVAASIPGMGRPGIFLYTVVPLAQIGSIWCLAVLGTVWGLRQGPLRQTALLVALALVFALLPSANPIGYSKYRIAGAPLLCILAGLGGFWVLCWLSGLFKNKGLSKQAT